MLINRGIYLVANKQSEELCQNLIYSIRQSGCALPIKIIHFGGDVITSPYVIEQAQLVKFEDFPLQAQELVATLRTVLKDCPMGFLYRFLAWYGDWDEFIYSDNDIVALCNWDKFFEQLEGYELVNADEEYITEGRFNFLKPEEVKRQFGAQSLEQAVTAGHFAVKRSEKQVQSLKDAVQWFMQNPGVAKGHDQALLHIAILLGNWKALNLCKPPHSWLSSWAGDYKNALAIIHQIQMGNVISHLHYSGGTPTGSAPIQDFIFSYGSDKNRLQKIMNEGLSHFSGLKYMIQQRKRVMRRLKK